MPDDVNVWTGGPATDILNALDVVFDAASTALNTKFDVVVAPADCAAAVPDMTAVPPSLPSFESDRPVGKLPDCNSNVTFPADSGSVATTVNLKPVLALSATDPKEPADVTKTGEAFTLI